MPSTDPPQEQRDAAVPGNNLALLRRYRDEGDLAARDQLVEQMLPWMRSIARRYDGRGFDQDDLAQVAAVGLLKAIERFDFSRGVKLTTFAEPTVSGEIKRYFRDHGWLVRPPRDLQELNARVMTAIDELTKSQQQSPTIGEIAQYLSLDEETVLEAMHAGGGYRATSLEAPGEQGGAPQEHPALATEDEDLARSELRQTLGGGLAALSERERRVVHMRFFEELTQSEIAEAIGVSQMQVSRIIRSALQTVRDGLEGAVAE